MSAEFLLTTLIVVLLPGTGMLYTLATGLGLGARASVFAAIGCTLGILPQLLLADFGLSVIFHASGMAFRAIKIAGALYLIFMAWQVFRDNGMLNIGSDGVPRSNCRIIGMGIWMNILNPKIGLFFLAFLPQFVSVSSDDARAAFFILGMIFVVMTFIVFTGYGLLAAWVRNHVITRPLIMNGIRWSFSAAFIFLGLRLVFESI